MKDFASSIVPLGDVIEIQSGFAFKSADYQNDGHFLVRIANVQDGFLSLDKPAYVALDVRTERFALNAGDLLTSLTGNIGRVAEVKSGHLPAALNQRVARITPKDGAQIDRQYLLRFLGSSSFSSYLQDASHGAAQANVSPKVIKEVPIPLPPLEEQRRIVAVLDEAFEGLARARAHTKANLQNARELFTANVDELLSSVGDDWSVGPISRLVGPVATGPFGSLLHKSDYVENETPLVNPANIINGKIVPDMRKTVNNSAVERLSSYILAAGDIVIGRRGEMGRCAVVEHDQAGWLCGTGSFFIRPNSDVVSRFVAHVLRLPSYVTKLEAASTGATMANLSNRVLCDLEVALPSREQQLEYLEVIDGFAQAASQLDSSFTAKLQDLDNLRQSLLQKAFAGELT